MSSFKINHISKLIRASTELINCINRTNPNYYNVHRLRSISFIMKEYFNNNNYDWCKLVNINNFNKYGYHKYNIYSSYDDLPNNIKCSLITWSPGAKTELHGHPNTSCIMMPINHQIKQNFVPSDVYESLLLPKGINNIYKSQILNPGQTSYIDDEVGYHSIYNDTDKYIVSLHIYENINTINNIYDIDNINNMSNHNIKNTQR